MNPRPGQPILLLLLALLLASQSACHPARLDGIRRPFPAPLETGDLIFLDLDCGPLCVAIEEVTRQQYQVAGPALSHVGLIERDSDGRLWVWEAWPARAPRSSGVVRTPLPEVLSRVAAAEGRPGGYWVGRLRPSWRALGRAALGRVKRWVNSPYDEDFLLNNGRFYCSELIYHAFQMANQGQAFFSLHPMYFGAPGTAARRTWETYYHRRNVAIPEGQPGLSPLSIYLQGRQQNLFQE
jgi:hypothetical protein